MALNTRRISIEALIAYAVAEKAEKAAKQARYDELRNSLVKVLVLADMDGLQPQSYWEAYVDEFYQIGVDKGYTDCQENNY